MSIYSSLLPLIDRAEYQAALRQIGNANLATLKAQDLYILLKLYNRLQWLEDANAVAERLGAFDGLSYWQSLELGCFYGLLGDTKLARDCFRPPLKKHPNDPLLISEIAFTYEQQGDRERAENLLTKLLRNYRKQSKLDDCQLRVLYRLVGLRALSKEEITYVRKALSKARNASKYSIDHVVRLLHVIAIHHRKLKEYDLEVELLIEANDLAKRREAEKGGKWSLQGATEIFSLMKSVFPSALPDWLKRFADADTFSCDQKIVFILGMPRSGTTLVEQIIGAHSLVGNCGESCAFDVAVAKALMGLGTLVEKGDCAGLRNLRHFSVESLMEIRERYLAYQRLFNSANVISDKQLALVNLVGILVNLFPHACFVYVQRDPLDNCVSLMQRDFNNAPYSNDPLHIVQEGELYKKRMEHWISLYPGKIYSLKYDELVSSPNSQIPKLIQACGLDWEPEILNFHERQNSVRTPSASQVRAKLNTDAVEKWHRYERLIKPAIEYLGR